MFLHMQESGAMWVSNCIFQGAGLTSRAIDINTSNEGDRVPEIFIQSTNLAISPKTAILASETPKLSAT